MATSLEQRAKELYEFGPFRVDPEKELLLRGDDTVPLTPKTFQILLVLIRRKKEVVTKDELLKAVWPDTFVEEANLSRNVFLLRKALGESPQDHQYIVTVPGRGYRFAEEVQLVPDQELSIVSASHSKVEVEIKETHYGRAAIAAAVLVAITAVTIRFFVHPKPALTEKDTIVLADFANSTGDPVFDDTLRQGLAVALEQSPFLTMVPDQRIQQNLRLMGQSPDAHLTPQIARDVCERTQSAAYLTGSIARLGGLYVIGLKAVSCPTGDVLAEEQQTAPGKEKVLGALDDAAEKLRKRLGESLSSVAKYDIPLEQATTPSLEALHAYTLGRRTQAGKDDFGAAVPFLQRAIQLDPHFAMAYAVLSSAYRVIGETRLAEESAAKAYEFRDSASGPERFYIESTYYHYMTGDLEKARQVNELTEQIYPRNSSPHIRLWQLYEEEGQYETALPHIQDAIRLEPWKGVAYENRVSNLIKLNRMQEAKAEVRRALADSPDSSGLRIQLYKLAFLENDARTMAQEVESVRGKPHFEPSMLELESQTAAYSGHLKESRDLAQRAAESALRAHGTEFATSIEVNTALLQSLFGHRLAPRTLDPPTADSARGRMAQYVLALTLALSGDSHRAQALADDLARRYPEDTLVQFNFLPAIRAQVALNRGDPAKAIEILQSAGTYELSPVWWSFLGPVYVRGEAYLAAHRGAEAVIEFQKILDHRGVVANNPIGALAHLQLGRAYVLSGEIDTARRAYQDFLSLWKGADPDIPILKQAKAEYRKLN